MADVDLTVVVNGDVELSVGAKTAAWLVSLGWTEPVIVVPEDATGFGAEFVDNAIIPATSLEAALADARIREAARQQAQTLYMQLLSELDPPNDRMLKLMDYFGINMDMFLMPSGQTEV